MSREGFLSRWSRRKTETETKEEVHPVEAPAVQCVEETAEAQSLAPIEEIPAEEQEAIVADLPDIESLTEESDFSAFMKQGVPEELQKLALRKLWKSSPIFANLDGLNDYDEDFSIITPLAEGVAEELQKLMKENSRTEPELEEEGEREPNEPAEAVEEPNEEDDHDVGEGEDG
ncbi:DUF3306 domain-containing protein [Terasakiella sp. SH-1]|uniref:DUF3306 domain-containing protein n=1 Tax=Terasakiella sp. SH-1 TaxID=2560057 RepID=UPI001073090B|nr:DUF3306 domain-containing protein [Terasakiella sp. SH-1]